MMTLHQAFLPMLADSDIQRKIVADRKIALERSVSSCLSSELAMHADASSTQGIASAFPSQRSFR